MPQKTPSPFERTRSPTLTRLSLKRPDGVLYKAVTASCESPSSDVLNQIPTTAEAATRMSRFSPERKATFLNGRLCAFLAVRALTTRSNFEFKAGVLGQPFVCWRETPPDPAPTVSISHSADGAIAIATDETHPMTVDLETIDGRNLHDINLLSERERFSIQGFEGDEETFMKMVWTCKEALSKMTRTGLMADLDVYETMKTEWIETKQHYVTTFRNFHQFRTISWIDDSYVFSICLPKRSEIESIEKIPLF